MANKEFHQLLYDANLNHSSSHSSFADKGQYCNHIEPSCIFKPSHTKSYTQTQIPSFHVTNFSRFNQSVTFEMSCSTVDHVCCIIHIIVHTVPPCKMGVVWLK